VIQLIKQLVSPTGLLYVFMVLTQIVTGIYAASGVEPPASFTLIYILGFLWIMGWWLRVDSRTRGVGWVFDMGLFLYVAWPLILPYYVLKSRGRKGLLAILCFVAVYIAATLVGVALYLVFAPRSWSVSI
jgi:hypothetical protein